MVLQSFLFPDEICRDSELYYRIKGTYREETDGIGKENSKADKGEITENGAVRQGVISRVVLGGGAEFSSDTYMNLMDVDCWVKFTKIRGMILSVMVSGKGKLVLMEMRQDQDEKLGEICFDGGERMSYQFRIVKADLHGRIYFRVLAETEVIFYGASFSGADGGDFVEDIGGREVKISLVICTYKREEQLARNLERLGSSDFFRKGSKHYGTLCVRVVDNAAELEEREEWKRENWYFYRNRNTGGAGGFTRGIVESQNDLVRFPATHILLMDDDVEIQLETFYRLYALLSFIREEYIGEVIAGRMFCLDRRTVQYTAADIWNGGFIRHIGYHQDMTQRKYLYRMNQERGEYSGWWFACFPMEFTIGNLPVPFFLHCDDVEYGLRHGGQPILLNGIQVWHETYLYRQSAVIHYYDVRNTAFTNTKIQYPRLKFHLIRSWLLGFLSNIRHGRWKQEYMKLLAIQDYMKGEEWLSQIDPEENHQRICLESERRISVFLIFVKEIGVWIKVLGKKM